MVVHSPLQTLAAGQFGCNSGADWIWCAGDTQIWSLDSCWHRLQPVHGSRWPAWAAEYNVVSAVLVAKSLLAPTSTRKLTISRWLLLAAMRKGPWCWSQSWALIFVRPNFDQESDNIKMACYSSMMQWCWPPKNCKLSLVGASINQEADNVEMAILCGSVQLCLPIFSKNGWSVLAPMPTRKQTMSKWPKSRMRNAVASSQNRLTDPCSRRQQPPDNVNTWSMDAKAAFWAPIFQSAVMAIY